MKNGLKKI